MPFDLAAGLAGKRVLLTGACGGIGGQVAMAFADAGARVALVDRDTASLEAVADALSGGPHPVLAADLRQVAGHAALVDRAAQALDGLDVQQLSDPPRQCRGPVDHRHVILLAGQMLGDIEADLARPAHNPFQGVCPVLPARLGLFRRVLVVG